MKFNKVLIIFLLLINILFASQKEQININFKDLQIIDLIKITSKILKKSILLTTKISGKVDFISNKTLYNKDDILNILLFVLEEKGYTVIENKGILRVVRISNASKHNIPIYTNTSNLKLDNKIITEIFVIKNLNVDYISSKIRHLISKSAKLVTDKNSNSIIVTDFLENIKTIKKAIRIISEDSKKTIKTIEFKNIQASSVVNDLRNVAKAVFNEKIEKEKVAILLNKATNSIMLAGKKSNVQFLTKYLLDIENKGSLVEKTVNVIYLKNAEAKGIMTILTGIIGNKKYKDPNNKPFASINEESNAIILMGQKKELKYFTKLIEKLDIDRQQVYVKARIIEISDLKTKEVGIKYGLAGFSTGSSGLATLSSTLNGGNALKLGAVGDSVGLKVSTLKKGVGLGMTLNLLSKNGAADILSEPSLLCINNKQSSIYVGETRSIKTGTTTSSGGVAKEEYKREDIGLSLKVKPRISNGNKVLLEITTVLEDADGASTNEQPNTYKRELETTAIVNNGENVILGGYIKLKKGITVDKVPFFGDIPLIGGLFRSNKETNDKINLVIIITPYIIPKSKDLTYVRDQLSELKLLEDKYTKDTILRLEHARLESSKRDIKREKNKIELDRKRRDIKYNMLDFSEDKKDYYDEKAEEDNRPLTQEELLHQKRVKEMFGI